RTLEGAKSRRGGPPHTVGRAGRLDARPVPHVDADSREPAARAGRAAAGPGSARPGRSAERLEFCGAGLFRPASASPSRVQKDPAYIEPRTRPTETGTLSRARKAT